MLDWWNQREEGPQAWRVDYAATRATAIGAATPQRLAEAKLEAEAKGVKDAALCPAWFNASEAETGIRDGDFERESGAGRLG